MSEEHKKLYNFFLSGAKISSNRKPESLEKEIRYSLSLMENVKLVSGDSLQWVTRRTVDGVNYVITKQAREYEEDGISISPKPEYFIAIEAPEEEVEKPEKDKKELLQERLRKIKEDGWTFVPAFCLGDSKTWNGGYYTWYESGAVAICGDPHWGSPILCQIPEGGEDDAYFPELSGEFASQTSNRSTPYFAVFGREEGGGEFLVHALQVAGGTDNDDVWDDSEQVDSSYEETDFNPGPVPNFGYFWNNGGGDAFFQFLFGGASATYGPRQGARWCAPECYHGGCLGTVQPNFPFGETGWTQHFWLDGLGALITPVRPGEGYVRISYIDCYSGPDHWTCATEEKRQEKIYGASYCGGGHLFAEWYAIREVERRGKDATCAWSLWGGMCQEPWYCIDKGLEELGHYKSGDKQEKQRLISDTYGYWLNLELGSGAKVEFGRDMTEYVKYDKFATAYLEGCRKIERVEDIWTAQYSWRYQGTHVLPEFSQEREKMVDAWFCVYMVAEYDYEQIRNCGQWGLSNYGWKDGGYYSQGDWDSPSDCVAEKYRYLRRSLLYVNVLGTDVLIDETEWADADWPSSADTVYYEPMEVQIFDFFGIPVFMYGYILYWWDYDISKYVVDHIRYGYFMGSAENHVQTEKFYFATELSDKLINNAHSSSMHDVFGLGEKFGFYAHGRCCGFAVKRTKTSEEREEDVVLS